MDTQDATIPSIQQSSPKVNEKDNIDTAFSKEDGQQQPGNIEEIDDENVFSFRKKRIVTSPRRTPRNSNSVSHRGNNPLLTSPSIRPARSKSILQNLELTLGSERSVSFAPGSTPESSRLSTPKKESYSVVFSQEDGQVTSPKWDTIWKCSWIVPALVPVNNTVSTNNPTTVPTSTKRTASGFPQRKSTLSNHLAIFDGKDGIKVQGTVTELPGIVFALPASGTVCHPVEVSPLQESDAFTKEDIEMHLVARIRICTFPIFLLAPGCTEPCRIFTSPDAQAAAQFLKEILNDDDICYMKEQLDAGIDTAMGSIGLLMRVVSKQAQTGKKKSTSNNHPKQEVNPFLMPVALGSSSEDPKSDSNEAIGQQRRLFQDTSMFLVYGALVKDKQPKNRHSEPIVSFFAYPLVDQASFMNHILLNARSLDKMTQEAGKLEHEQKRTTEDFISYDDPMVDSIMNGCDSEQESGYSSDQPSRKNMGLDEDDSLQQEMELLRAIERNRSWSPYVVTSTTLPAPSTASISTTSSANKIADSLNNTTATSKEVRKERSLSRAQTTNNVGMSKRRNSSQSSSSAVLSRHRSMDNHVSMGSSLALKSGGNNSIPVTSVRKGISRIKSPSRAPQKPLDVTTEGLRRKLLGPGSIRKTLSNTSSTDNNTNGDDTDSTKKQSFSSMHIGMKSPSRRAAVASGSRGSSSPLIADDIPDLMTMMKMKKRQNMERAALARSNASRKDDDDDNPFSASSPSPIRVQSTRIDISRNTRSENIGSVDSNPFLVTLKNIQSEVQRSVVQERGEESNVYRAKSTSGSANFSRPQLAPLPAASSLLEDISDPSVPAKSIESRNQATIKGLTASVLSKNNIGPDHEEFDECADHLFRTVTFAMRRDIATKVYHLEELERLMD
ncbi:hypothetical protein FBU30_009180, partial [Linnemannia zychae]